MANPGVATLQIAFPDIGLAAAVFLWTCYTQLPWLEAHLVIFELAHRVAACTGPTLDDTLRHVFGQTTSNDNPAFRTFNLTPNG